MFFKDKLNIFYHPTSTIFLDDNQQFLSNLILKVHEDILFTTFPNSELALNHINAISKQNPDNDLYQLEIAGYDSSCITKLNISDFTEYLSKSSRFAQPSVVVVDYDMPEINGLQFCKKIPDQAIKKILLTGIADEKAGIQAFNQGFIDYYLTKATPDLSDELNKAIFQLQTEYFEDKSSKLRVSLQLHHTFLAEPMLIDYFKTLCKHNAITEYYFTPYPCGYLLVDTDGNLSQLLVYNEDELDIHAGFASDQEAPAEIIKMIDKRERIPFFHIFSDGYYRAKAKNNWRDYFYPADKINGKGEKLYCALINDTILKKRASTLSYNQYRKSMAMKPNLLRRQNQLLF